MLISTDSGPENMQLPISILPGDKRMEFVSTYFQKKGGHCCTSFADIAESGYIICGVPFSKDGTTLNTSLEPSLSIESFLGMLNSSHILIGGNLPREVINWCTRHNIKYYDVLTSSDLGEKNARLTAEGLLVPLLTETQFSLCDFRTLIIGYGKCGKEIAHLLRQFTNEIYIYDIEKAATKSAKSRHFKTISQKEIQPLNHPVYQANTIINTAPGTPFTEDIWKRFSKSCRIFQVASGSLILPDPLSENLIMCPGIPGKYTPETAGRWIAGEICSHFHL